MPSDFLDKCSHYDFLGGLIGDKANSVVFDNSKIKRLVPEYNAVIRFDQGIRKAIDYVLAHPEYQLIDEEFDKWCDDVLRVLDEAEGKLGVK